MVSQAKIAGYVAKQLGQQLANAQSAAEQKEILKNAANSQKAAQLQAHANPDRTHGKYQGVKENEELLDRVHISPKAQALYHAHEAKLKGAPEKIHERVQERAKETDPKPEAGVLGPMDPEA